MYDVKKLVNLYSKNKATSTQQYPSLSHEYMREKIAKSVVIVPNYNFEMGDIVLDSNILFNIKLFSFLIPQDRNTC